MASITSTLRLINRIPKLSLARYISTSNKKSDVSTTSSSDIVDGCKVKQEEKHDWQSYGWHDTDEREDLNQMHSTGFFAISIGLVGCFFVLTYRPDVALSDWSQREAFLELRRREKLGLPLIDPNYVNPANIVLPSDEELGDTEIVI